MASRILIVDDSEIFRQGLRATVGAEPDWEICGEAFDGLEAIQKSRLLAPDLIIMDLTMPRMGGIEAASEILNEFPHAKILLLTLYMSQEVENEARKVGIRAAISKIAVHHLDSAIRALLRGDSFAVPAGDDT